MNEARIDSIFESTKSYEQKIAEIIYFELTDPEATSKRSGLDKFKKALATAQRDYNSQDMNGSIKGFIKLTSTYAIGSILFKMAKSAIRLPNKDDITDENYLIHLYNILQDVGGINFSSLKGFLLKELLYNCDWLIGRYSSEFRKKFDDKTLNLKALRTELCALINLELNIKAKKVGPQNDNSENESNFTL